MLGFDTVHPSVVELHDGVVAGRLVAKMSHKMSHKDGVVKIKRGVCERFSEGND